jgi:hypothetical protein
MEVYLGLALLVVVVIVAYVKFIKPVKDAEKKGTAAAQNEKIRRTLSEIRRRNSLTKTPPTPAKKVIIPDLFGSLLTFVTRSSKIQN